MKKFPIILTLLLAAVWAYTCWYWYTCNIKGFCEKPKNQSTYEISEETNPRESTGETEKIDKTDGIVEEKTGTSQTLSAQDVLFDPLPKEQEDSVVEVSDLNLEEESETLACDQVVGPISFGGDNNSDEVQKLETFLIARGEVLTIDGTYGADDQEAMKKFQLAYKTEVLDPWGIENPTGYVGKTSLKKINELLCQ